MKVVEKAIIAVMAGITVGVTALAVAQNKKAKKVKRQLMDKEEDIDNEKAKVSKLMTDIDELQLENLELQDLVTEGASNLMDAGSEIEKLEKEYSFVKNDYDEIKSELSALFQKCSDQERIIANQGNELLHLRVEVEHYRPVEIKQKKKTAGKSFRVKSVKGVTKNINYTLWSIIVETKELIQKPMISDGYFQVIEKGDEKTIMIKRAANEKYNDIRSLISKCESVTDIFSLHNNVDRNNNVVGA